MPDAGEAVARQAVAAALNGSATFRAYGFEVVPGDPFVIRHLDGTELWLIVMKKGVRRTTP